MSRLSIMSLVMSIMNTMSMLSTISRFQMSFEFISLQWVYSKKSQDFPKMHFFSDFWAMFTLRVSPLLEMSLENRRCHLSFPSLYYRQSRQEIHWRRKEKKRKKGLGHLLLFSFRHSYISPQNESKDV